MEWITGELRKLTDLKASGQINEEEHAALKKKVLEGGLVAPAAPEKDLVDHFASEALKKHQAWRHAFEDFQLQEAAWKEEDLPSRQETFLNMAKGGGVSPLERMLAFYALYGTIADVRFFQALIATVPDDRRIEYHNWYVARARGEAFLAQFGSEIAAGAPPLFGPQKEFGALNVALLKTCGREVYGSGRRGQPCFEEGDAPAGGVTKTIFAAGYPVAVVDGYVDLGIVEEAVSWLDGLCSSRLHWPMPRCRRRPQHGPSRRGAPRGRTPQDLATPTGGTTRGGTTMVGTGAGPEEDAHHEEDEVAEEAATRETGRGRGPQNNKPQQVRGTKTRNTRS